MLRFYWLKRLLHFVKLRFWYNVICAHLCRLEMLTEQNSSYMYNIHKTIQGIPNLSTLHGRRSLKLIESDKKTVMNSISTELDSAVSSF